MAICYLSGPITEFNNHTEAFTEVETALIEQGHTVINPDTLPDGLKAKDYLRVCFAMIESADTLVLLPEWECSRGTQIEKLYAEYIGLRVIEWEAL